MKKTVTDLVDAAIAENDALFLIDLSISPDNNIKVIVDGDEGVPLSECIRISRHVEHNLDRDEVDFSLEVTSPDVTDPIVNNRQFNKNINRLLKVKTDNESIEGNLIAIDENNITLQWKTREAKPVGKGKKTVVKEKKIPMDEIKQAKVKFTF
jgi:ribosome maturation factor RimP